MAAPLATEGYRAVRELIERYDLNLYTEVPISVIARREGWTVQYRAGMFPAYGLAVVVDWVRCMAISEDVSEAIQRSTIAHEMAHVLLHHQRTLDIYDPRSRQGMLAEAVDRRQEFEADLAAALIMVPDHVLAERPGVEGIMRACRVSRRLAELRLSPAITGWGER